MRVKSLELANARPPGSAKFANAPPLGTDKAGKWPAVARGGGQLELTDALTMTYLNTITFQLMKRVTYQHNGGMVKFLVKVISSEIKKNMSEKINHLVSTWYHLIEIPNCRT